MRCSATVVLPEPATPRISDEARRPGHELELARVEEAGDVGQVAIAALAGGVAAELMSGRVGAVVGTQRGELAAGEPRQLQVAPAPAVALDRLEHALRRLHAPEGAVAYRDRAARGDHALAHPVGDLLLELLALPETIEDARDRCVPPVDDRQPGEQAGGLAEQDVVLAAVLAQPEVREVGRAGVDRDRVGPPSADA